MKKYPGRHNSNTTTMSETPKTFWCTWVHMHGSGNAFCSLVYIEFMFLIRIRLQKWYWIWAFLAQAPTIYAAVWETLAHCFTIYHSWTPKCLIFPSGSNPWHHPVWHTCSHQLIFHLAYVLATSVYTRNCLVTDPASSSTISVPFWWVHCVPVKNRLW